MGIEPLGSAMAYQAQPTAKEQSTQDKASEEIMDVSTKDVSEQVDKTTSIVKKAEEDQEEKSYKDNDEDEKQQRQPSNEQLKRAVENLNKRMYNSEALFGIHEKTNRVTIKIVDRDTKEIIKEFPPEKTLDMIAKAWELAGILVDERR